MKKNLLFGVVTIAAFACNTSKQSTSVHSALFDKQGHRGSRGLMPENTIPAMLNAIDLGVTTLEMDVVISKDNKVVVSHDPYFSENITTTPAGKYLTKAEAVQHLIYTMPYDSIRKYDVGLKPHPDFPQQKKMVVHKPLLKDLIEATEAYAKTKGSAIAYNIEIKSKPGTDGERHPPVELFVDLAMQVIQAKGIDARTTIQSFDPRALQVMHRKYPSVKTSLLMEGTDKRTLEEQLKELGFVPDFYSPHFSLVNASLVKQCHDKKIGIIPWTVNTVEEMKKQKEMGVDGIITDYPNLFAQLK